MNNNGINRQMGTKWFTFYTKVRPWFAAFSALGLIGDFVMAPNAYLSHWWMILYFIAGIGQSVLAIMAMVKSYGNYADFVKFVKYVLYYEVASMAYCQGAMQYYQYENITSALIISAIFLLGGYFLWYVLNIKYFEKRIFTEMNPFYTPDGQPDIYNMYNTYNSGVGGAQTEAYKAPGVSDLDTSKARFCRKCGNKLSADSVFCSYCGTKITNDGE